MWFTSSELLYVNSLILYASAGLVKKQLSSCEELKCDVSLSVPVIPQHGLDSGSVPLNGEEMKPAVYYERLKILRQRQGLENNSRVSLILITLMPLGLAISHLDVYIDIMM